MRRIQGQEFQGHLGSKTISDTKFVTCNFTDCDIPSVENSQFSNCTFKNVTFAQSQSAGEKPNLGSGVVDQEAQQYIANVHFFDCVFKKSKSKNSGIIDVIFSKCCFEGLEISNAHFSRMLTFAESQNLQSITIDLDSTFGESFKELVVESTIGFRKQFFRWSNIRVLSQFPIPKIGFAMITAGLVFLPVVDILMTRACKAFVDKGAVDEDGNRSLDSCLSAIPDASILMNWTSAFLLILLCTSILHRLFEPDEIRRYSLTKWTREFGNSQFQYRTLDAKRPILVAALISLYVTSVGKLSYDYFTNVFPI